MQKALRVAVLWSHSSGYMRATLQAFRNEGNRLLFSFFEPSREAPFSSHVNGPDLAEVSLAWPDDKIDSSRLILELERFSPELILISGWNHQAYRLAARRMRGKAVRVLCMDNPWEERPKQWAGRFIAPWYVKPLFDAAFVGGERQFQFARKLGFDDSRIFQGVFSCDHELFDRGELYCSDSKRLLFAGRLTLEKGIPELISAFSGFKRFAGHDWSLAVAGTGPLSHYCQNVEGVISLGFVQPEALAQEMAKSAALVAPSRWEPWGVQIHEAAAAGLPIVCTTVCGSAVHLVRDGFNGFVVPPQRADLLEDALVRFSSRHDLAKWSARSQSLSNQFSPRIWCETVSLMHKTFA